MTELLDGGEMWHFIKMDLLTKRVPDLGKFYHVPVIFARHFLRRGKKE